MILVAMNDAFKHLAAIPRADTLAYCVKFGRTIVALLDMNPAYAHDFILGELSRAVAIPRYELNYACQFVREHPAWELNWMIKIDVTWSRVRMVMGLPVAERAGWLGMAVIFNLSSFELHSRIVKHLEVPR